MTWFQDNALTLAAALGGLYAAARAIVALTPTPKDDAALEKVTPLLRGLAKLFGLDLKQGREQPPTPSE